MDSNAGSTPGNSSEKFTRANAMQSYVSFTVYLFDILSFILLVFVGSTVSEVIYPNANPGISLLVFWGAFAAGSVTRPLGAAFLAPYYDRVGRKRGIAVSLVGASIFTALIGFLPTYAQAGDLSPILFIALRLIAGIFIGALISGGLVFGPENVPERLRGLMTGFAETGANWAHVIGAAWLLLASLLFATSASFAATGWRFFFMISLAPLILVLPILSKVPESEIHVMKKKRVETKGQYKKLFGKGSELRPAFVVGLLLSIGLLGYDQMTENTIPTFLGKMVHVPHASIATLVILGGFGALAGTLLGGVISQKVGRKPVAMVSSVILILISVIFIYIPGLNKGDYWTILMYIMPFYFFPGIAKICLSLYLNESFPTEARATGLGLSWNIGYGLAGVWPMVQSALIAVYGLSHWGYIQFYTLIILGVVYLIFAVLSKETRGNIGKEKNALEGEGTSLFVP